MANNLGEMVVSIVGETAQFDSAIDKSQNKLVSFSDKATKLGIGLSAAVTLPLVAMGKAAIQSSAQMEMLQASFTTMLGSATKATTLMNQLKNMAAVTPFETTDLADASKTLLQFGVTSEKLLPTLQMLGDIAQGNGPKFNSLALVFGQMSSAGKLMGQDLMQMINAGFNPLKVISEKTGESMSSLKDKMSKGAISADQVTEAFKMATSQGGLFYKGMETASKTFDGLTATLKDDIATMGRSFVENLMPILKDIVKGISSAAQWITGLDSTTKTIILTMGGFAAAAGPVLLAVGGIAKAILGLKAAAAAAGTSIGAIMGPAGLVIGALAVLATGIALFAAKAKAAKEETEKLNAAITRTASVEAMQEEYDKTVKKLSELQVALKKVEAEKARYDRMGPGEYEAAKRRLNEQIDNLTAQKNYIARNIQMTQMSTALQEKAATAVAKEAEGAAERNNIIAQYEEKLKLISLELSEGIITEAQAADKRKEAVKGFIDSLNGIIIKYQSISTETKAMVNDAISEFNRLNKVISSGEAFENVTWEQYAAYKLKVNQQLVQSTQDAYKSREQADGRQLDNIKTIAQINEEFTKSTYQKELELIEEKRIEYIKSGVSEVNANKWANDQKLKLDLNYVNNAISLTQSMVSQINSIINGMYSNQLDELNSYTNALLKANEEQLQSALKLADVADKTAVESAQEKLDAAIKANDEEEILEAKKALTKTQIEEDYAKKEEEIKKESARKEHDIKVKQFKADQAFQIAQVGMDTASGIIKIWSQAGINVVLGGILTAALAGLGIAKIATISGQKPPELALGEGGIIPATPGGVNATLAEAGQTEVVFPLDRLEDFIDKGSTNNDTIGNIDLKVYLDSKPFLSAIFPATKNKTVLISSKAIV